MTEPALRTFLLVQAAEESDRSRRVLRPAERERAAAEASGGEGEEFLERRSRALLPAVEAALGRGVVRPPAWLAAAVAAAAFASGFVIDRLEGGRQIHLLSFPLLGLLVWNLFAYVAAVAALLWPMRFSSPGVLRLWGRVRAAIAGRAPEAVGRWRAETILRFLSLWVRTTGDLEASRFRRALHLAAAAFAAGAVAGLYARGFAFEYRASWESTFLESEGVATLLGVVFGPASALLGLPLPDAEGLAALRAPASGPAALWIHLWAMTLAFGIVLPRLALAGVETLRARRAVRQLRPDPDDPYVLRLLAPSRGEGLSVVLVPYGYRPTPETVETVRELVLELFGNRVRVAASSPLAYGADAPSEASDRTVVLLSLAQTPEQEVHGGFLDEVRREAASRAGGGALLVVLDAAPFHQSVEVGGAERSAQRERAWARVLRECGLEAVLLPQENHDEVIREARRALWPGPEAASA